MGDRSLILGRQPVLVRWKGELISPYGYAHTVRFATICGNTQVRKEWYVRSTSQVLR